MAAVLALLLSLCLLASQPAPLSRPSLIVWYEDVDMGLLSRLAPEIAVIEPEEASGGEVSNLRSREVTALAYLSLGTAEEWRSYWREEWVERPPEWMGGPLEGWPGEYLVKF